MDAKADIRRPTVSCILELARSNPLSYRELQDAGIVTTLRHMLENHSHVGASPTVHRHIGGRQMGAEDDTEVQERARQALHWLERSADNE